VQRLANKFVLQGGIALKLRGLASRTNVRAALDDPAANELGSAERDDRSPSSARPPDCGQYAKKKKKKNKPRSADTRREAE